MADKKSYKKKKLDVTKGIFTNLKEKLGPVQVSPSVTKQSSVEGKVKSDVTSGGLGVGTKYGNINLRKTDTTESMSGFTDYKTKDKSVSYDKRFKTGKNSHLDLSLNKGKSKSSTGFKTQTKGATITFTKTFTTGGYTGSYIKSELDGKKVSNKSYEKYYKGMIDV